MKHLDTILQCAMASNSKLSFMSCGGTWGRGGEDGGMEVRAYELCVYELCAYELYVCVYELCMCV